MSGPLASTINFLEKSNTFSLVNGTFLKTFCWVRCQIKLSLAIVKSAFIEHP